MDGGVDAERARRSTRCWPAIASQRERFGYILRFREVGAAEQALLGDDAAGLSRCTAATSHRERVADDVAFFAQPGVLTAALSWYRAMSPSDADGLGPVTVPTAYVWGGDDQAFGRGRRRTHRALRARRRTASSRSTGRATGCRTRRPTLSRM